MSHETFTSPRIVETPERMTPGRLVAMFKANHAAWSSSMQFREAVAAIRRQIEDGETVNAVVLAEQPGWRTTLLGLAPGAGLPLHDHPRTRGLLYVETGSVAVERYDVLSRPGGGRTVMLADRGTVYLEAGDHDWIGKNYHNLHALKAGDAGALIVSVRQSEPGSADALLYACIEGHTGPEAGTRIAIAIRAGARREMPDLD